MGDKYDAVETGDNNIDDHTGRLVARTTTDRVPKIPVGRSAVEHLTSMWRCRIMGTKEKEDKATIVRRNDRADRRTSVDSKTVLVSLLYNCTRIVLFLFFHLEICHNRFYRSFPWSLTATAMGSTNERCNMKRTEMERKNQVERSRNRNKNITRIYEYLISDKFIIHYMMI